MYGRDKKCAITVACNLKSETQIILKYMRGFTINFFLYSCKKYSSNFFITFSSLKYED